MDYTTGEKLNLMVRERRIVELTADTGEVPDAAFIDALITAVSAEISGYLGGYALPITDATTLAALEQHALKILVYRLTLRANITGEILQDAKDAADRSFDWLADVATGKIVLPAPAKTPEAVEFEALTSAGSDESLFDADPGNVL